MTEAEIDPMLKRLYQDCFADQHEFKEPSSGPLSDYLEENGCLPAAEDARLGYIGTAILGYLHCLGFRPRKGLSILSEWEREVIFGPITTSLSMITPRPTEEP